MAQVPVSDSTFKKMFSLKNKAVQHRNGKMISWDQVVSSVMSVAEKHSDEYLKEIENCVLVKNKHDKKK